VGVSDDSIHQAVSNAVNKASQTLRNIDWFEVSKIRGAVHNGKPTFEIEVRIGLGTVRIEPVPGLFRNVMRMIIINVISASDW
jgi:dodecin